MREKNVGELVDAPDVPVSSSRTRGQARSRPLSRSHSSPSVWERVETGVLGVERLVMGAAYRAGAGQDLAAGHDRFQLARMRIPAAV